MSGTLSRLQALVSAHVFRVSDHAFAEMRKDDILPMDVILGLVNAAVVEDYPDANRGPTVLVLFRDSTGKPVHAVWGIHRLQPDTATLITAYRPKPDRWAADFLQRKR